MENRYTKLYQKERELLRKTNSVNCYEVYMHLKDKYSYFKEDCYDLMKCISEYLDIPQRSVKDAIKRLKDVGLIDTVKRGKVNVYSFPMIDDNKKNKPEPMIEETPITNPLNDVEDDNDFRYGEIDTTNPMVAFLREDEDEPQAIENSELNDIVYKLIKSTGSMEDVKQEYVNDMVSMIKDVTKDGVIDWSLVNMWVTKLSFKYNKGKTEIDRFFKLIMDNQVA